MESTRATLKTVAKTDTGSLPIHLGKSTREISKRISLMDTAKSIWMTEYSKKGTGSMVRKFSRLLNIEFPLFFHLPFPIQLCLAIYIDYNKHYIKFIMQLSVKKLYRSRSSMEQSPNAEARPKPTINLRTILKSRNNHKELITM